MKTRIISGIIMGVIVAAVLVLGLAVNEMFITAFIAIIAAIGCLELVGNAAGIKSKAARLGAGIFSLLYIYFSNDSFRDSVRKSFMPKCDNAAAFTEKFNGYWETAALALVVVYFLYSAVVILKNHKDFNLARIVTLCAMPLFVSFAFSTLGSVISHENGIYYLLLLLNFSSVCDMGAYFSGVTLGKHKLCPEISPKKTVEGAIGGILSSIIVGVIIVLAFGMGDKLIPTLILTIPLCIVGMIGDLFASAIKRSVDIKDYGTLIPGHGGVLDRVDSILMIAPLLYLFAEIGVI